jgi:formylglycine-generating enzyme required for sulfatase activity
MSTPVSPIVIAASDGKGLAPGFLQKIGYDLSGGNYSVYQAAAAPRRGVRIEIQAGRAVVVFVSSGSFRLDQNAESRQLAAGSLIHIKGEASVTLHNTSGVEAVILIVVIPGELSQSSFASSSIVNSVGMPIVKIPCGRFLMGSPGSPPTPGADPLMDLFQPGGDEFPQHEVMISKPFGIGMYPVTKGEFRRFVEQTGYVTWAERNRAAGAIGIDLSTGLVGPGPDYNWRTPWKADHENIAYGEYHPVVSVAYNDAAAFCAWLSGKEGRTYRLPTEAEWEYACRAGSTTQHYFGDDPNDLEHHANVADQSLQRVWIQKVAHPDPKMPPVGAKLPPYAVSWDDRWPFVSVAGKFKPNPWGLYDMHGNVGEWCSDWYDPEYYKKSSCGDPQGPALEDAPYIDISFIPGFPPEFPNRRKLRVVRGGVWLDPAIAYRSADRRTHVRHPVDAAADIGFRVVLEWNRQDWDV